MTIGYALLYQVRQKAMRQTLKLVLPLLLTPTVTIFLYSVILWVVNGTAMPYITRGVSDTLYRCIAYLGGTAFLFLLRKDVAKCGVYAITLVYCLAFIFGFKDNGVAFAKELLDIGGNTPFYTYVELHEMAFTIGLYLLLLMTRRKKELFRHQGLAIVVLIFFYLEAGKRIGMMALVVALAYYWLFHRCSDAAKRFVIRITGVVAVAASIIYVGLTVSNQITQILGALGINMKGRDIIYGYFRQFCAFDLSFIGRGVGFVSRQFDYTTVADLKNMISIKALHNDLFRIFIDVGMVGFILWCGYWLLAVPEILRKRVNTQTAFFCMAMLIYAFVTYITDNTENYPNFQMHMGAILALVCLISFDDKIKKRSLSGSDSGCHPKLSAQQRQEN
ncbi:MAG: O-antigen ligase family protein [Oscillospiraceae bacterium]|nr:O-antigen ligase family protein [Oscillospiraceae bacterium]